MFGSKRLAEILKNFRKIHLLVVGDLMLDRFIWGEVERLSPEAPVPVLRVCSESSRLGGAANVVHNVRSLGAQVTACGVVGADGPGATLIDDLQRVGASTSGVFADREVHSIQKTRIIARPSHQQIVRLDRENHTAIRDATLERICRFIVTKSVRFDAILVSDYGKGVVHPKLLKCLASLATDKKLPLVIDPKKENFARYQRASLITPNKDEASDIDDGRTALAPDVARKSGSHHPRSGRNESLSSAPSRTAFSNPSPGGFRRHRRR
jgi:D-beta-D-heptose 7-phosphate kinase/D-beta-D-heptose 1-phosphate adenosyltransferase